MPDHANQQQDHDNVDDPGFITYQENGQEPQPAHHLQSNSMVRQAGLQTAAVDSGTSTSSTTSQARLVPEHSSTTHAHRNDPTDMAKYPLDFDAKNASLLDARLASMDRELDGIDWSLPKETPAEKAARLQAELEARQREARRRLEHPTPQELEGYQQYARVVAKLSDPTDPFVRCCGEWGDEVLGRASLHMDEAEGDEKIFGFKTTT
ncbi:hypothetical protein M409DRAFT_29604 [Zasmidium cellare ATCC 36951]|uniref:Uncharacterized protein n=1 Tax=Zasmidium cellare ATCC 36951 TaxID=1080233 RepID=A0A6A6BYX8_ZASCE|nr:uncharacterized protein M409DRAFT_29604 [Zasmidium cellare ATCC 36951]KAF2159991.1 hypothetical protein M409DRAFT_29604 [Zasmidium cellare ATCC 36951]